MQVSRQRYWKNFWHVRRVSDKNLINCDKQPDSVLETGAGHCFCIQNRLASTVDHVNASDPANQNMVSTLRHFLKRGFEGKSRERSGRD